jgi:hypothetical protein
MNQCGKKMCREGAHRWMGDAIRTLSVVVVVVVVSGGGSINNKAVRTLTHPPPLAALLFFEFPTVTLQRAGVMT